MGKSTAMSTPSISMPITCATASYSRSMAKSSRPVSASREPDRGCVLVGRARAGPLPVLLQLGVLGGRQAVDDDGAAAGAPVLADREDDAVLESRIQVALEQVGRFHDVHVAVHESQSILHRALLWFLTVMRLLG